MGTVRVAEWRGGGWFGKHGGRESFDMAWGKARIEFANAVCGMIVFWGSHEEEWHHITACEAIVALLSGDEG